MIQINIGKIINEIKNATETNRVTKQSLALKLKVSESTIGKRLTQLKDENIPIKYDDKLHSWILTDPSFRLEALQISEQDLFTLFIAERMVEQYKGTDLYPSLKRITEKLGENSIDDDLIFPVSWFSDALKVEKQPTREIDKTIWDTIIKAIKGHNKITLHYKKMGTKKAEPRIIIPIQIIINRGIWYLISWQTAKKEIRNFALNRIEKVVIKKETVALNSKLRATIEEKIKQNSKNMFGMYFSEDSYEIELCFSKWHSQFIRETTWPKGYELSDKKNGQLNMKFKANNLIEVQRWVRSFGKHVKVLNPQELQDNIKEELKQTLEQY